nr:MAG TPA: hypothetical protein [Bacteriophage sp.]
MWSDKRGCHASQTCINTEYVEFCSWLAMKATMEVLK